MAITMANMAIHLPQQYIYIYMYMVITSTIIWLNIYNSLGLY